VVLWELGGTVPSQSKHRGTLWECDMGAFEKGVDMPRELSHWVVPMYFCFRVEKDTPFLTALKASFFSPKTMCYGSIEYLYVQVF